MSDIGLAEVSIIRLEESFRSNTSLFHSRLLSSGHQRHVFSLATHDYIDPGERRREHNKHVIQRLAAFVAIVIAKQNVKKLAGINPSSRLSWHTWGSTSSSTAWRLIEIHRSTALAAFPSNNSLQVLPQTIVACAIQHTCVIELYQRCIVVLDGRIEHQRGNSSVSIGYAPTSKRRAPTNP
jgi:hypothetical protein